LSTPSSGELSMHRWYLFTALNFNENRVWKKGWTKSALAVTVR